MVRWVAAFYLPALTPLSGEKRLRFFRHLQHWLMGCGPRVRVADFVPETHALR